MAHKGVGIIGAIALTAGVAILWHPSLAQQAAGVIQQSQSIQSSSINLALSDLKRPQILKVSTSNSSVRMTGTILRNGRLLQSLKAQSTQLNLSPLLREGRNVITLKGQYYPKDATITVELKGANNHITQQMSGNGMLNQELVIEVE